MEDWHLATTLFIEHDFSQLIIIEGSVGHRHDRADALREVNGTTQLDSTTTISGALISTVTIIATATTSGTVASGRYLGLNSSNQVALDRRQRRHEAFRITSATWNEQHRQHQEAQTWAWGTLHATARP